MITKDFFKERLRQLRTERGETQVQVGETTGLGARHYQEFERGSYFPSAESLCLLADHFEVSVDYLLGRTDER